MNAVPVTLTAELISRAIVAAADQYGFDPAMAFTPKLKGAAQVRILAANAVARRIDSLGRRRQIGALFQLDASSMSRWVDGKLIDAVVRQLPMAEASPATPHQPADRVAAAAPVPKVSAPSRAPAARKLPPRIDPIKPTVVRWARQFLSAGWSPREVAHLFDVDTPSLRVAIGEAA